MYNAELKNSFIDTYRSDNSYKSLKSLFDMVESFETKFKKDICEMNIDELTIVLNNIGVKKTTRQARASLLKMYIDFCIKNGKTSNTENNLEKIFIGSVDNSAGIMMSYIKDPEEFEEIVEKMFYETYKLDESNVIDEVIWRLLYYYELSVEAISAIKKVDIDYDTGILTTDGREVQLDDKVVKMIEIYNSIDSVTIKGRHGYRTVRLRDNEFVVRKTPMGNGSTSPDSAFGTHSILRLITRNVNEYNENSDVYKKLTPAKIIDSHAFYRTYISGDPLNYINEVIKEERHLDYYGVFAFKTDYTSWEKAFF